MPTVHLQTQNVCVPVIILIGRVLSLVLLSIYKYAGSSGRHSTFKITIYKGSFTNTRAEESTSNDRVSLFYSVHHILIKCVVSTVCLLFI